MSDRQDQEKRIVDKIEKIHQLELEALRRAGVAEEKKEGLKIESTEALRLFREATGYLLRLRDLRAEIKNQLRNEEVYHINRILGHLEDYN